MLSHTKFAISSVESKSSHSPLPHVWSSPQCVCARAQILINVQSEFASRDWQRISLSLDTILGDNELGVHSTAHSFRINFISILLSLVCGELQSPHLFSTHTQQVSYFTMLSSSFVVTRRRAIATVEANTTNTHTHFPGIASRQSWNFAKAEKLCAYKYN